MSGATTALEIDDDTVTWTYSIKLPDAPAITQQYDLAAGIGVGLP